MTLIKSISGIRGTIGGNTGQNLTPVDIAECTAGFGMWMIQQGKTKKVVVGRDGRSSGYMVSQIAIQTLLAMGIDVVDLELSTTPTVEMMVPKLGAGAGIIFTASHNPGQWNALKFLNDLGEFISAEDGEQILSFIEDKGLEFAQVDNLGKYTKYERHIEDHVSEILAYPLVDVERVRARKFKVVADCINSTGAIALPPLLEALGVEFILLNDKDFGNFAHNPEPLPLHLTELADTVVREKADLGISVDPDVDRLAFICEDGTFFGEEYTLVAIADYMLSIHPGRSTVSNLSSSRALADITRQHDGTYHAAAVGEVNVVKKMKETNALIGGEGNGGVIVPDLHYGRDALAGVALFLSYLTRKNKPLSQIKKDFPDYMIIKDKIELVNDDQVFSITNKLKNTFSSEKIDETDGVKIDFTEGWVHLRKSNTEPIIRIYAESTNREQAEALINRIKDQID